MKRFLLILLLVIASCDKSFKAPEPDKLIEQPVMEEILYDISLLKAAKSKSYKILKDNNVQADIYIYEKYKIDSITLRQNIEYYATESFKTAKQIEEHIKLRFDSEKNKLEKIIQDNLKNKKGKDSAKLFGKRLQKELIDETNSYIISKDYTKWGLVHSVLKKENNITDGSGLNIIKLVANEINYQHRIDIPTHVLDGKYEFSVCAKKAGMSFIRLRIGLMGTPVVFNLENGSVSGSQKGVFVKIEPQDFGWYKCKIKCIVKETSIIRINIFESNLDLHYSGDNIKGVYLRELELKKNNL